MTELPDDKYPFPPSDTPFRLDEMRKRYEFIINTSRDLMTLINKDYIYEAANDSYCRAHNKTRWEIIGRKMSTLWGEDVFNSVIKDHMDRSFRGEEVSYREVFSFSALGPRHFDVTYYPYCATEGPVTHVVVVSRDVTESVRSENELLESENRYRSFVEAVTDYIYTVEIENGRPVRTRHGANCVAVTGYTAEEYEAEPGLWSEMVFEEDRETVIGKTSGMLTGEPIPAFEHRIVHKDGSVLWVRNTPVPRRNAGGEVVAYDGLITDITERKMAEEALKRSYDELEARVKERTAELARTNEFLLQENVRRRASDERLEEQLKFLQTVIDAIPLIIFYKDKGLRYRGCNKAYEEFLGRSRDHIVGKTVYDLFPSELADIYHANDLKLAESRSEQEYESIMKGADGGLRDFLFYKAPYYDIRGNIAGLVGVMVDITERKRFERALALAREAAETSSIAKSEFLANMSHEIRTPMNAVIGMTSLVLNTDLSEEQREYLEMVKQAGESLLSILNGILDLSKIDAGKMELEEVAFNLPTVVAGVAEVFGFQAKRKGISFHYSIDDDVPQALKGDPLRLRQVLLNLVGNALKFTLKGEVAIEVSRRESKKDDSSVILLFTIRDTGIGIPRDQQQKIFERFTQADGSSTRRFGGTGLGLTICMKLVELMKGGIWVESRQGHGSAFSFTAVFAAAQDMDVKSEDTFSIPSPVERPEGELRILVVEDNLLNQILAVRILEKYGHAPLVADNGLEAMQLLEKERFDLVLMDVHMPEMDGYEATRAIRDPASGAFDHSVPIIAMTANAMKGDREKCLAAGMDAYISKPISTVELIETVNRTFCSKGLKRAGGDRPGTAGPKTLSKMKAIKLTGGNEHLYAEICKLFAAHAPNNIEALGRAVEDKDIAEAQRQAHSLKSMAATIGAEFMSDIAFQMELAAKEKDFNKMDTLLRALRGEEEDAINLLVSGGVIGRQEQVETDGKDAKI